MEEKSFEDVLKSIRISAGKTVAEVSSYLTSLGYRASEKTVYSWEAGRSQPNPTLLLAMCDFYGISDVLSTFGYKKAPSPEQVEPGGEVSELFDYLNRGLISLGFIGPDDDITPQQSDILLGVCRILQAAFDH